MNTHREGSSGLLRTAIARPVTVSVGVVLVLLFGALSVADLPVQLTPDVAQPVLSVNTWWPGAAPVEIETEILERQEEALKDIDGLVEMTSTANLGEGSLRLELEVGTPIDEALVRVTNRLSQVAGYPEAAEEPVVETADSTGPFLAVMTIRAHDRSEVAPYRTWVYEEILPELQRIPGVASAILVGGRDTEVHIDFDPVALAARGLTVKTLSERVQGELRDVSGGDVTLGKRRYLVRTPLVPTEVARLEQIVVGTSRDGTPTLLRDVADVGKGLRKPGGMARHDDRPSMIILLRREVGTNVLEVTQAMRDRVHELNEQRFAPEGLKFEIVSDQKRYIGDSLNLVRQNLLLGAVLAVIVLVFFLRSLGASAIIAISIPVSVFGTALGMMLTGRTINVVSLAGITFAVGMVLDNSIVSLESIDTWRRKAKTAAEAAYHGVREVWGAILASTLTTCAVFLPIITWDGEVGQLLRDVAVAITLAVGSSLVVSVMVIPSLAARLLKPKPETNPSRLAAWGVRFRNSVGAIVGRVTQSMARNVVAVVGAVGAAVALSVALMPPIEYLPVGNRNLAFGMLVPPPGSSVEEIERMGVATQARMLNHLHKKTDGLPALLRTFFVGTPSLIYAGGAAENPDEAKDIVKILRRVQSKIPGVFAFAAQAPLFGNLGGGRSVEVDVSGSDLAELSRIAGDFMAAIQEQLPGGQVRPIPSLDPGVPELHVVPRREEAARLEMNGDELGLAVDALVDGAIIGEIGPQGEPKLNVVLRARSGEENVVRSVQDLESAPVATSTGRIVPLGALARFEETLGPNSIRRIERRRAITLQMSPAEDMPIESAIRTIQNEIVAPAERAGDVPAGVRVELSGTAGKLDVAKKRFVDVLLLAVLISFLLLSALFEDFLAPLAVLITVPLAGAGGLLGLALVDQFLSPQPLDLMTALGFLILIGVVVNNAILVVDGALGRLREGDSLEQAVVDAVKSRVRPMFMTTLTSLAGLLPMVLFPGAGSELYRGVGAIVLGGLALSSVLTLFVVPSLFSLLWKARGRAQKKLAA